MAPLAEGSRVFEGLGDKQMIHVVSFSTGKDSMALWLWAKRQSLEPRRVIFCDTGWEKEDSLAYRDMVENRMGEKIETLRGKETFEERVRRLRGFPSSGKRWCTQELKLRPTRDYLDRLRDETGDDVILLVGVRAEESKSRACMKEREWSDFYDCEVWRPLIDWKLRDVLAELSATNMPLNPLYYLGAERVGCWPCINAGKTEIALVARTDPDRISRIREMEKLTKNTMFSKEALKKDRAVGAVRTELPLPIDDAVAWANTKRGGKEVRLVQAPSGCARWGICDLPMQRKDE